jgi:heme oxygenase
MITGTIKEISSKYLLGGVVLTDQEWYTFVRILDKCGKTSEIAKKKHDGAGRQSRIYQVPENISISLSSMS